MKCEKCSNEAVFHYQSIVNGEKSEYHLCADCAKKEGFGDMLEFRPHPMYVNLWREPFGGLSESFFRDPFVEMADNFFGRGLFTPILSSPEVKVAIGEAEKTTESEREHTDNIPEDAGTEIRSRRELFAMKHQLRAAVRAEEFEKAAELRDKIRELER